MHIGRPLAFTDVRAHTSALVNATNSARLFVVVRTLRVRPTMICSLISHSTLPWSCSLPVPPVTATAPQPAGGGGAPSLRGSAVRPLCPKPRPGVCSLPVLAGAASARSFEVGERLSYGITLVLCMTTYQALATAMLPVCGELLWIELFNFYCFIFSM